MTDQINIVRPDQQEIGQHTGTLGRANEFAGLAQTIQGATGLANTIGREKARESKREAQQELVEFQVNQLNEQRVATNVAIKNELSEDQFAFLQGQASIQEKYALAQEQGVGDAYLRLRRMDAYTQALRDRPELADELSTIYRQGTQDLKDIESQLDDFRAPMQEAKKAEIKRQTERLYDFGVSSEDLEGMSSGQITAMYNASPLRKWDTALAEANLLSELEEKQEVVTAGKIRVAREQWMQDNPGTLQGIVAMDVKSLLSDPNLPQDQRALAAQQAKSAMVAGLISRGFAVDQADAETAFKSTLAVYDSVGAVDVVGGRADVLQRQTDVIVKGAELGILKSDADMVKLSALQSLIPSFIREAAVTNKLYSTFTSAAAKIADPDFNLPSSEIADLITKHPVDAARTFALAQTSEDSPEGRQALEQTLLEFIGTTKIGTKTEDQLFGQMLPVWSNPKTKESWDRLRTNETNESKLKDISSRLSKFGIRQVAYLETLPNLADLLVHGEDGLFHLTSTAVPGRELTSRLNALNSTIQSVAHLSGIEYADAAALMFGDAE